MIIVYRTRDKWLYQIWYSDRFFCWHIAKRWKAEEDEQERTTRRRTSKEHQLQRVYQERSVSFNSTLFDIYEHNCAQKYIVDSRKDGYNRDTCFEIALEDHRTRRTRETCVPFRGDWHLMRQWPYHAYESRVSRFSVSWFRFRLNLIEPYLRMLPMNTVWLLYETKDIGMLFAITMSPSGPEIGYVTDASQHFFNRGIHGSGESHSLTIDNSNTYIRVCVLNAMHLRSSMHYSVTRRALCQIYPLSKFTLFSCLTSVQGHAPTE